MRLRLLLALVIMMIAGMRSEAKIPVAGVYEGADKNVAASRNMYVVLDFINGTPDFTQQFTTKESAFKVLPKDFMNAKKISKAFAGTRADGFSRYRSKVLFSNWEEMKITNPRLKNGIVICDWVDTYNRKGKCAILRLPNDSITIYGLSTLDQSISPDGLRLELVKSLLPAGTQQLPQLTDEAIASAKKAFESGCIGEIERLDKMKDDASPAAKETSKKPTPKAAAPESDTDVPLPVLWRDNGPTMYEFKTVEVGGDYGRFETNASLDFWGDATTVRGEDIACREFITTVYENGRMYESEYIYYGHKAGNKVIFTHRYDSLEGGYHNSNPKIEKLDTPIVLKATTDGKGLVFGDFKYKRTY